MASNLGCVGLGVDDAAGLGDLLAELIPTSTASRQPDGSALYVWRDESGARLTIRTDRSGAIADATPSYDGQPGADLAGLRGLHHAVVAADVMVDGEVATRMAVEVLGPDPVPDAGHAVVTGFGIEVTLHGSAAEFAASPASLLRPEAAAAPRPADLPDDVGWPPRLAAESFFSDGLVGDPSTAEPLALLTGTVLAGRTATVAVTGQRFHAVRVRTVGMEIDVCLAAEDHPAAPEPGAVVAGVVYLVADVERTASRRWLGGR
jgi:hypothetical protein